MEDVIRKNLLAIRQNNKETRDLCHETFAEVENLKKMVLMQQKTIEVMQKTIIQLRVSLGTGSTS